MLTIEKVHAGKDHKFENNLISETSPYLLQHAHNPVHWFAWSEEAFAKAKKENKPVLLSIGYSTCHWCHVMEHESFEDLEIADWMNQHYVAIKIDREQRPDIDAVYMSVVQGMTGRGGWPMTMWLTPDKTPFYGGTYFPARDGDRGGQPGFLQLLQRLSDLYAKHPSEINTRAQQIAEQIKGHIQQDQSGKIAPEKIFDRAFQDFERSFDARYGGFGMAPKFPRPSCLQFLFHYGAAKSNQKATTMALDTLRAMLRGGIFDQVGGGFHRYSVDAYWLVSHFEKMLYDQSQIVLSLTDAWQLTKDSEFKRAANETLDYILREMTSPDGGFYSATDADSEGVEGKFFVWDLSEVESILGQDVAQLWADYFGVTQHGNFEEKNIFFIKESVAEYAIRKNLDIETTQNTIRNAKEKLYQYRSKRIPPLTDDKIITAWNGLMIAAFANAGFVFHEKKYIEAAKNAAQFVLQQLINNGDLYRSTRAGKIDGKAFLDDHANLIFGLLRLFEVTGEVRWFEQAKSLQDRMIEKFWDSESGGFYANAEDLLFVREKPFYDGAEPSGNSIAAWNLMRLSAFLQDLHYQEYAEKIFRTFSQTIETNPTHLPQMLVALDYFYAKSKEIVVVRSAQDQALLDVLRSTYIPNFILISAKTGDSNLVKTFSNLGNKLNVASDTAYVCQSFTCQAPAVDAETFQKQLKNS